MTSLRLIVLLLEINMSAVLKEVTSTESSSVKIDSYPASEKIYVQGSRPDIQRADA